jgi:hypothetical protein
MRDCHATACDACRQPLGAQDKTCPKWRFHKNEDCRFWNNILPHFLEDSNNINNSGSNAANSKNKSSGTILGKREKSVNSSSGGGASDNTKASWKALKASIKASKRVRRGEDGSQEELA